jgi:regulator of protease activity HflC (stomatin/prohibitin superfamily)
MQNVKRLLNVAIPPVTLIAVLFLALAIIYLQQPTQPILIIEILVLGFGVMIVLLLRQRGLFVLGGLVIITIAIAIGSVASSYFGLSPLMSLVVPLVAIFLLYVLLAWTWRTTINVPHNTELIIRRPGGIFSYTENITTDLDEVQLRPLLPFFEQPVASIPRYGLSADINAEDIQAPKGKVKKIVGKVNFSVADATKVYSEYSNRAGLVSGVVSEMKQSQTTAMQNPVFWEKLLSRVVGGAARGMLGDAVLMHLNDATEAFDKREDLKVTVKENLERAFKRAGLQVVKVSFSLVENGENRKKKREDKMKDETEDAQIAAEREAHRITTTGEAQATIQRQFADIHAKAVGQMIHESIQVLKQQNLNITPDIINEIVRNAFQDAITQHRLSQDMASRVLHFYMSRMPQEQEEPPKEEGKKE